jgi:hypothetical protein
MNIEWFMLKLVFFNTDTERFDILKNCCKQLQNQNIIGECFSEEFAEKVEENYIIFDKIKRYNDFIENEKQKRSREFDELFEKARLYFIHYYQVIFMAIERGELTQSIISYYDLQFPFNIPNPKTPEQLISMSEHLFKCDNIRIENGGKYFANPSIGSVKVWFEKFMEKYREKTNKYNVKQAEIENIENIRQETDSLIYEIFDTLSNETVNFSIEEQTETFKDFGFIVKCFEKEETLNQNIQKEITIELLAKKEQSLKKKKKIDENQLQFSLFSSE